MPLFSLWASPSRLESWPWPFPLLPTHLETVVEDTTTPEQPGRPLEGTGRSREVEPLRRAGDDSQNQGRCPLSVQEVYPHLGEKATTPRSRPPGKRPPTQQCRAPHPSQRGMLALLRLEGAQTANSLVSFRFSLGPVVAWVKVPVGLLLWKALLAATRRTQHLSRDPQPLPTAPLPSPGRGALPDDRSTHPTSGYDQSPVSSSRGLPPLCPHVGRGFYRRVGPG